MSTKTKRTPVIGIYGIPGCGKTYLLKIVRDKLDETTPGIFKFFEGSEAIDSLGPEGLAAAFSMERTKTYNDEVAVVTGHLLIWDGNAGSPAHHEQDLQRFSHIIYFNVDPKVIRLRRSGDRHIHRGLIEVEELNKWQEAEKTKLRNLCAQHGILFIVKDIHPGDCSPEIMELLQDFHRHNEDHNLESAKRHLCERLKTRRDKLEKVLVINGDRTLVPQDTGQLLLEMLSLTESRKNQGLESALKNLFRGPMGYSYTAFRQAVLRYEEIKKDFFHNVCDELVNSNQVRMRPEFESLLGQVVGKEHVAVVVVSSGLRSIFDKLLQKQNLSDKVDLVAGGRISDGFVVPPSVKAALVTHLQKSYEVKVFAFGDGIQDLDMLNTADQAVLAVGENTETSQDMAVAIEKSGRPVQQIRIRQALFPPASAARPDVSKVPIVDITSTEFVNSIISRWRSDDKILHLSHRTSTKLLRTPLRDAKCTGPALRDAHHRIGWYLTIELLTHLIGVDEYLIPDVQEDLTGHSLLHMEQTLIVALMRGGEPMAQGINDACADAMFLHAKAPDDVTREHIRASRTIHVVDSVVNSGKRVFDFIHHIRAYSANVRIVVVAAMVKEDATARFREDGDVNLRLVALHLSKLKSTGEGGIGDGARLYNTYHLEKRLAKEAE